MELLQVLSFNDIFKKTFLEGWQEQQISTPIVVVTLLSTLALAVYLFFVYRLITKKTFYEKNFNISLAGVALITAAIIITIRTSIVISLGMVGALSIVRFRTAIKNPMDLMFLFWAISIGIICGAGYSGYAVILSAMLTITVIILEHLPVAKASMILVVNSSKIESMDDIISIAKKYDKHCKVKARTIKKDSLDLTIEIRTSEASTLVNELSAFDGIRNASLLQHDGEVTF